MTDKVKQAKIDWLTTWLLTNTDPNIVVVEMGVTARSMATQIVMALEDIEVDDMMKWADAHRNDPTPF